MAEPLPLLTIPETLEAAAALRGRLDTARDARRAITGTSTSAIASMAELIGQLDAIAQTAASFAALRRDHASQDFYAICDRLVIALQDAGYLPLPETTAQEATHGEG